ncbi:diguanylate cyclase [Lebetimonas sp. JS170]|uniref:diguanylate cyclase n=2 Tax=Lebetimonas TaxID=267989 RepID=UPI0009FD47FD|nr:diguanylate cyclase [Lebetimonas sp. JS170]
MIHYVRIKNMTIEKYVEDVYYKECNEVKDMTIKELIVLSNKYKTDSIYLTKNKYPVFMFEHIDFLDVLLSNELDVNVLEYIKKHPKKINVLNYDTNIIDAYYYMRSNNLKKVAVIKNNELIGEVNFKMISARIADIVIKDPLTGVYNEKYFEVLIEEYKDFDKPLGIIYIDIKNTGVIEGLYGREKVNEILKAIADKLKNLLRDIDFIFRNDFRFKIITFSPLDVTEKIINRIRKSLDNFEIDGIKIAYSLSFSHIPELESNVLLALDDLERNLID